MPTIASSQTMYNKHTWLLGAHDVQSIQARAHEIGRVAVTFSNSATRPSNCASLRNLNCHLPWQVCTQQASPFLYQYHAERRLPSSVTATWAAATRHTLAGFAARQHLQPHAQPLEDTHTHMHVLMDRTHMFQPPSPAAAAADHGGEAHTLRKGRAVRLTRRPWTARHKSTRTRGQAFVD